MILITHNREAKGGKRIVTVAIGKLAVAGEQAGFSIEYMIQLLDAGLRVEALIEQSRGDLREFHNPLHTQAPRAGSCDPYWEAASR